MPRAKTVKKTESPKGVQKHGKKWENEIITVMVSPSKLEEALDQPYTATHDLPKLLNKKNPGMNVSIKAAGKERVDFGDAKRTIHNLQKPNSPLEAIVIKYKQTPTQKIPTSVVRIDLTKGKTELLGKIPEAELAEKIDELDEMVKEGNPAYKATAKKLQKYMKDNGATLMVAPKIGNAAKKRAGRLQISLPNITQFKTKYPHLVIEDKSCKVYGEDCLSVLESGRRVLTKKNKSPTEKAIKAASTSPKVKATRKRSKPKIKKA